MCMCVRVNMCVSTMFVYACECECVISACVLFCAILCTIHVMALLNATFRQF